MPRASDYLLQGYTYHLTQRCHDREFLLRFRRDRNVYREWLREGVKRHRVPVYGFCITGNHVHVLAHVDSTEAVSHFMHLASCSTAKQYNLRKHRTGSMWQHPYHCTIVEDGRHLMNCLVYISLNMVRAGKVSHPEEWIWSSHDELTGRRTRYRILNTDRLLHSLDMNSEDELRSWYADAVRQRLTEKKLRREAQWTESLAVGSRPFVERTVREYEHRLTFDLNPVAGSNGKQWTVREARPPYTADARPEIVV